MILMHRDIPAAEVTVENNKITGYKAVFDKDNIPPGTLGHNKTQTQILLKDWYESRSIPAGRVNLDNIIKKIGIDPARAFFNNAGVSLTDTYWLKTDVNDGIKWIDINFHQNGFDPLLPLISPIRDDSYTTSCFSFTGESFKALKSPDFTTDGILEKFWYQSGDEPYLAKFDIAGGGLLCANEVFVSMIAHSLDIDTVPYFYSRINNIDCCSCPCFVNDAQTDFVPAMLIKHSDFHLTGESLYQYISDRLGFKTYIKNMIFLDCLIHNTDRHEKNFGYLVTPSGIRPAPLFDNGYCLGADWEPQYFTHPAEGNMKLFGESTRKDILERYDAAKDIDDQMIFDTLQDIYKKYKISEIRYDIAKKELETSFDIIAGVMHDKTISVKIPNQDIIKDNEESER